MEPDDFSGTNDFRKLYQAADYVSDALDAIDNATKALYETSVWGGDDRACLDEYEYELASCAEKRLDEADDALTRAASYLGELAGAVKRMEGE